MQRKIKITDCAERDLEDCSDYIAYQLKNPTAAIGIVKGIRKQINDLTIFPERNALDDDSVLASLGVRADYYKNYKIYYVVDGDIIYIIRILHMRVDGRAWLYRTLGLES